MQVKNIQIVLSSKKKHKTLEIVKSQIAFVERGTELTFQFNASHHEQFISLSLSLSPRIPEISNIFKISFPAVFLLFECYHSGPDFYLLTEI